jgi:hypothetical protein
LVNEAVAPTTVVAAASLLPVDKTLAISELDGVPPGD